MKLGGFGRDYLYIDYNQHDVQLDTVCLLRLVDYKFGI